MSLALDLATTAMLKAAYSEPGRAYHTLEHVEECLALLAEIEGLEARERTILEAAIWWHDLVYDPQAKDNEAQSARRAEADLARLGLDEAERAEVSRLILLTQGHHVEDGDRLGALLVSIDLAILGAEPGRYDRYAADIRKEYAFAPDALYRLGRGAVLERFLAAPRLFPDAGLAARFEARARANLAREHAALK